MKKPTKKNRKSYTPEFKEQAIQMAKDLGSSRKAAEKLGIENFQTLAAWVRYSKKVERLRAENKKLKKELDSEKKAVAILRDAAAFFCQDQLK